MAEEPKLTPPIPTTEEAEEEDYLVKTLGINIDLKFHAGMLLHENPLLLGPNPESAATNGLIRTLVQILETPSTSEITQNMLDYWNQCVLEADSKDYGVDWVLQMLKDIGTAVAVVKNQESAMQNINMEIIKVRKSIEDTTSLMLRCQLDDHNSEEDIRNLRPYAEEQERIIRELTVKLEEYEKNLKSIKENQQQASAKALISKVFQSKPSVVQQHDQQEKSFGNIFERKRKRNDRKRQ